MTTAYAIRLPRLTKTRRERIPLPRVRRWQLHSRHDNSSRWRATLAERCGFPASAFVKAARISLPGNAASRVVRIISGTPVTCAGYLCMTPTRSGTMPNNDSFPTDPASSPRGPTSTPGVPDRVQEKPLTPPVQDPGDSKNPNDPTLDPALLPIGDPAGAA